MLCHPRIDLTDLALNCQCSRLPLPEATPSQVMLCLWVWHALPPLIDRTNLVLEFRCSPMLSRKPMPAR